MLSQEQLQSMCPIFKLQSVTVLWNDVVQKVNRHGQIQIRNCVVASPGIFLFEKRQMGGYRFSRVIGYSQIESIESDGQELTITGNNTKIEIIHKQIPEIIPYIVEIRGSLFDPIEGTFSKKIQKTIDESMFVFDTQYPLAQRFISNSLPFIESDLDQIIEISKVLENVTNKVVFSPDIVLTNLLAPLVQAVSVDTEVSVLEMVSLDFNDFVTPLQYILSSNHYITTLVFRGIVFCGESTNLVDFFKTRVLAPINTISFEHCELSSNKFTNFLLAFSKFKCRIATIDAKDCSFSSETIRALFIALFQSPCFPFLREFSLCGESLPDEVQSLVLLLSDKVRCRLQSSFKVLHLNSLKLNASEVIASLEECDSSLSVVTLIGSSMKQMIEKPISTFHKLKEINISNAWVTDDALLSFFKSLSGASQAPSLIVCDHLHMTENSFTKFYEEASQFTYPSITSFSWENNTVKGTSISAFFEFLEKMPNAVDVSISNTIYCDNETVQEQLINFIQKRPIERFIIRGYGKTSFGTVFVNVLRTLASLGTVKALDITGQCVNDDGLTILTEMINTSLTAVSFDAQQPTSAAPLIDALEALQNQRVEFATWPEENVRIAVSKVPIKKKGEIMRQFDNLKKRFSSKFNRVIKNCLSTKGSIIDPSLVPRVRNQLSDSGIAKTPKVDFETFDKVDDDVNLLLCECLQQEKMPESFLTCSTRQLFINNQLETLL